jgi:NAD(P)-dependent dehydrogenase (short-subunit alcohol dehydrogenase family)
MIYGPESTTDDVLAGIDLAGKRALVTGASTGLGEETARALASAGAAVTLAVRDQTRGDAAADRIRAAVPGANLEVRRLDLASLASVRAFADAFLADHDRLDLLVNNAGIMACPQDVTADGFEMQFGTNHLGHFLLASLLAPALVAAAPSRVVALSSAGHRRSDVDLDDPGFETTPYEPWIAYGRSKTANALFAVGFDHRFASQGVRAFAVHPGVIATELSRHLTDETLSALISSMSSAREVRYKSVPQGAATSVWAATSPELEGRGGLYLEDCHIAELTDDPEMSGGVRAYALDPDRADALWARSEELIGTRAVS